VKPIRTAADCLAVLELADIRNLLNEGELRRDSVVKEILTAAADGKNYTTRFNVLAIQ